MRTSLVTTEVFSLSLSTTFRTLIYNMGKGCQPRKGHNPAKQRKNYDDIDWSKKPIPKKTK